MNAKVKHRAKLPWSHFSFAAFLLVMVCVTVYFANILITKYQDLSAGATTGHAEIFFEPSSGTIAPTGTVSVWATLDKSSSFLSADVRFDPSKLKLTADPLLKTFTGTGVTITPMSEANETGKIMLSIIRDPLSVEPAPTGSLQLASFTFASKASWPVTKTQLTISDEGTQVVDSDHTLFEVSVKNAEFELAKEVSEKPSDTGPVPRGKADKGSLVTIYAGGTKGGSQYPTMQLLIDGVGVASWTDIDADGAKRLTRPYSFSSPKVLTTANKIQVKFINDFKDHDSDRNLYIDKIIVDDHVYESEDPTIYSTGTKSKIFGCWLPGAKKSEWLNCNGSFRY